MKLQHPLDWVAAVIGAGIIVWAWIALIGADPPQSGWWLAVLTSMGAIVGLVATIRSLYGGQAPSTRRRLVLDAVSTVNLLPRSVPYLAALIVGNLIGRLLLPADLYVDDMENNGWTMALFGVLFPIMGALSACLIVLLLVVPVTWLVASFLPDLDKEEPNTSFAVMSAGELRGGALVILSIAWLIPGLLLGGYRVGGLTGALFWYLSCVLAILLIVVGIIINNRAVRARNRRGVTTPFDRTG